MVILYLGDKVMKIKANDYKANEIVKIIREWSELTQKDFGKTISRSRDSINNIENGRNRMFLNDFIDMCQKHNVDIIIEKKSIK